MYSQIHNDRNSLVFLTALMLMVNLSSVCATPHARVNDASTDQFITLTYKETPMGLYLPAQTDTPLPIVMFLHGCHNNPVNRYHWIISALNDIEPCAVFLPTAPETQNTPYPCADWGGTYDNNLRPQMINALTVLDSLIDHYGFDTKRQYLYGESMGGEGVYRLLIDLPTRFAGAVDAAGYTLNRGVSKIALTPLWILISADDEISPVDSSRSIYNSILNAGGTAVKYTEYSDLDHVGGIQKAREEPGLLEWLLAQNRSSGIIERAAMKINPFIPDNPVRYNNGTIQFSSQLPLETIIRFLNLKGQIIFTTGTLKKSITLPAGTMDRVVLWNVSNSQFSVTGKMASVGMYPE